ncbi:MAG: hypothetical protein JW910_14400 [Anaerolineae bacterium]|nr:hypothetical protein [Anaerolineae bacterium]
MRRADLLRFIAGRLELPALRDVARGPGVIAAYRVTIEYHNGRHPNQVATLIRRQAGAALTVVYRRVHAQPEFTFTVDAERYRAFDAALRRLGFDRLDDQSDLPSIGVDLWLVERASGSHLHDFVLSPEQAVGLYASVVGVVREHLPQAVRAIQSE